MSRAAYKNNERGVKLVRLSALDPEYQDYIRKNRAAGALPATTIVVVIEYPDVCSCRCYCCDDTADCEYCSRIQESLLKMNYVTPYRKVFTAKSLRYAQRITAG